MELIVGAVFQCCMGATSNPEVQLFKQFQETWEFVDRSQYSTGMQTDTLSTLLQDVRERTIEFANQQLEHGQPRDDYREFLELSELYRPEKYASCHQEPCIMPGGCPRSCTV
jgi:hypothetical protein